MQKIKGFDDGTPNAIKNTAVGYAPSFKEIFDSRTNDERQRVRERERKL